jgi:low temperature requirement protein LtrA
MLINVWKQSNLVFKLTESEKGKIVNIGFIAAFIVILVSNLYNEAFYLQYASFSLSGQIMSLAALCLHPAWLLSDDPAINEGK